MVLGNRNNEGKGPKSRLCPRNGIEEEEENAYSLSMLSDTSPSVLDRTDSDIAISVSVLGLIRQ